MEEMDKNVVVNVNPELSEWECYLFGSSGSFEFIWRPEKGNEPNWFWRWMQFICFGNRWIKGG